MNDSQPNERQQDSKARIREDGREIQDMSGRAEFELRRMDAHVEAKLDFEEFPQAPLPGEPPHARPENRHSAQSDVRHASSTTDLRVELPAGDRHRETQREIRQLVESG